MRQTTFVYAGAAGATVLAGILQLVASSQSLTNGTMFTVLYAIAGVAEIFYAVPIVRHWGRSWYFGGTIGTTLLVILWLGTRIPSARPTGVFTGLLPLDAIGIAQIIFEFAALLLSIRIIQTIGTPGKASTKGTGYSAAA